MALGKQNRISGKAYSLKLKLKDGATFLEEPVFDVQEKQGDKYVSIAKETDVSGDLFRIQTRLGEYEGQPIRNVAVGLRDKDKDEAYFVEFGLGSGLGRSLANAILNLTAFDNVQIGLYGQKSKADGKTYPAASLRQGASDETVKWKFDPKDGSLPPAREFKGKGGKVEKDWTDTEQFLFDKLNEFAKVVEAGKSAGKAETPAAKPQVQPAAQQENNSEDIPF